MAVKVTAAPAHTGFADAAMLTFTGSASVIVTDAVAVTREQPPDAGSV